MALEDRRVYQQECPRCSQCKFLPMPESQEFSSICPSIDYGNFHAYSGGGKVITSFALLVDEIPVTQQLIDSVYACTMCGGCDTACKTNMGDQVEPLDTIYELRAHLANGGHVPEPLLKSFQQLRREGSHLGKRSERAAWAEGLNIKNATKEKVDVLLHVDGADAFNRAQWPQLHTLVKIMRAAGVDFGIAYDAENDSGGFAYELGFQDDLRTFAADHQKLVRQSGANVLLTASADAYAAFRGLYPRVGVELGAVKIVHATDYVAELVSSGRIKLSGEKPLKATYHDPCRLGRLSEPYVPWTGDRVTVLNTLIVPDSQRPQRFGTKGQYEAPRRLLENLGGLELVEMERNREMAYCCGAGAGVTEAYPEMAEMAAVSRLKEARKTGASCIVTACSGCERHLAATAATKGIDIEVRGIFDLLADAISEG